MNGFLNILKPPGMTSAAVVAVVKRLSGEKHIGHAGTLDPEAAGILPIMLGRAARLFDYLVDKEKTYIAEAAFGKATDSQDATGHVIAEGTAYPTLEQVREAAKQLTGDIWQRPSMFSAIKRDGQPLYKSAHRGETVEVPLRQVHVERIDVTRELPNHGMLMTVDCGRGTYIRSICNDLGELVGCPAHMRFLIRAKSGVFDLSTAMTLEELTACAEQGTIAEHLLPLDAPLGHMKRVTAPEALRKMVLNGSKLPADAIPGIRELSAGEVTRVYLGDRFCGIAAREDDRMVWRVVFPEE